MPGESAGAVRPDERYEGLVDELVGAAGVTPPRGGGGFGRSALRYQGRIFAMLVRGRLAASTRWSGRATAFTSTRTRARR
jgi:hypothetical protein